MSVLSISICGTAGHTSQVVTGRAGEQGYWWVVMWLTLVILLDIVNNDSGVATSAWGDSGWATGKSGSHCATVAGGSVALSLMVSFSCEIHVSPVG